MRRKVGLALGAGGTRGFAHIGVIKALEENGIKIDYVTGTSMGAVVGGLYVCGSDLNLVPAFLNQMDEKAFYDYQIPKMGLIAGKKLEELIKLLTKNMDFNETKVPFACVACDFNKARAHVFTEGKIYKAIRSSISVPGVFEPYRYDGKIFVDGAVVDRVPVQTCRDLGADVVIGVDVGYKGTPVEDPKNIMEVFMSTIDFMGWEMTRHKISTADYMIMPELTHVHQYKLNNVDETVRIGYETTMRHMPIIKEIIK